MRTMSLFFAFLIFTSTTLNAVAYTSPQGAVSEDGFIEMPAYQTIEDVSIQVEGIEYTLRAGTVITMETAQNYHAKYLNPGQTLQVRVKYNVVVKKNVLVAAGAVGTAIVSEVQRPKAFGKAGKMEVQVQSVQAVDGQQILIRGIPMTYEGEHRKGLAWGVAIGAGFFTGGLGVAVGFLFKGKDAELRAGTTISSTVASDSEVEIE